MRLQGADFRAFIAQYKGKIITEYFDKSNNGHYCVHLKVHLNPFGVTRRVHHWLNPVETELYLQGKLDYNKGA